MARTLVAPGSPGSGGPAGVQRLLAGSVFGLPPVIVLGGTAAGALLGVAFLLSPTAVGFGVAAAGVLVWSGRGLGARERLWIHWLVGLAIVLRVAAIAILFLSSEPDTSLPSFFYDADGAYMKRRSLWMRSIWLGLPLQPMALHAFDSIYAWTSYLYVLGCLQYFIGPAPFGVHLVNTILFVAAAVLMHRTVRATYGRATALLGLTLVLFLPSLFLWSISAMKESFQFFLAAAALTGVMRAVHAAGWQRRMWHAAVSLVATAAFSTVRARALLAAGVGMAAGLGAGVCARRFRVFVAGIAVLAFVGVEFLRQPAVTEQLLQEVRFAAVIHTGHLKTEGHGYKLLDQRFYSGDSASQMTPKEAARYVVRAPLSFLILPLPWQAQSWSELAYLPLQIAWYTLVLFAVVGLPAAFRRDPVATGLLAGYAVAAAALVAITSGNIGSMVRHRDTVVPFLAWISAVGALETVAAVRRQQGRHADILLQPRNDSIYASGR